MVVKKIMDVVKSHTKIDDTIVVRNMITTLSNNNSVLIKIYDEDVDSNDVVENNTIKKIPGIVTD